LFAALLGRIPGILMSYATGTTLAALKVTDLDAATLLQPENRRNGIDWGCSISRIYPEET